MFGELPSETLRTSTAPALAQASSAKAWTKARWAA